MSRETSSSLLLLNARPPLVVSRETSSSLLLLTARPPPLVFRETLSSLLLLNARPLLFGSRETLISFVGPGPDTVATDRPSLIRAHKGASPAVSVKSIVSLTVGGARVVCTALP